MPDCRVDVVLYEPGIAVGGRRADLASFLWQPRLREEGAELDRTATRWWAAGMCGVELGGDGFGFVAVVADRVPAASFFAGEWIEAVVGDDVEAVLALHDVCHQLLSTTKAPTRRSTGYLSKSPGISGACGCWRPRHNVATQALGFTAYETNARHSSASCNLQRRPQLKVYPGRALIGPE